MLPLLSTIITVYCVLRLCEMAATGRRLEKEKKGGGAWVFYLIGAGVIIILCYLIHQRADEFTNVLQRSSR
jgi:hypothetical protein